MLNRLSKKKNMYEDFVKKNAPWWCRERDNFNKVRERL